MAIQEFFTALTLSHRRPSPPFHVFSTMLANVQVGHCVPWCFFYALQSISSGDTQNWACRFSVSCRRHEVAVSSEDLLRKIQIVLLYQKLCVVHFVCDAFFPHFDSFRRVNPFPSRAADISVLPCLICMRYVPLRNLWIRLCLCIAPILPSCPQFFSFRLLASFHWLCMT